MDKEAIPERSNRMKIKEIAEVIEDAVNDAAVSEGKGAEYYAGKYNGFEKGKAAQASKMVKGDGKIKWVKVKI